MAGTDNDPNHCAKQRRSRNAALNVRIRFGDGDTGVAHKRSIVTQAAEPGQALSVTS
jgi:hypothetical protein